MTTKKTLKVREEFRQRILRERARAESLREEIQTAFAEGKAQDYPDLRFKLGIAIGVLDSCEKQLAIFSITEAFVIPGSVQALDDMIFQAESVISTSNNQWDEVKPLLV